MNKLVHIDNQQVVTDSRSVAEHKVRRRHLNPKIKKALTPSVETQERVEWAVAGVVMVLGTVVAVEVMAAVAAILM